MSRHAPPSAAAAKGIPSHAHGEESMPTSVRAGNQATSPAGTNVSRLTSASVGSESSGKTSSCMISCHVELLSSSADRGAQNARLPQAYENDRTTTTEHTRDTSSSATHAGVTANCSCAI